MVSLRQPIADIATYGECSEEDAEGCLRIIQSLDPPGIGARDIRESLLLQLDRLEYYDTLPYQIVEEHMGLLQSRNYAQIAREVGSPVKK